MSAAIRPFSLRCNRRSASELGISWNGDLEHGGVVVGDRVFLLIDAEAILED